MSDSAVMRSQAFAIRIEHILRNVFECDRGGLGGIVNSDYIRKNPFAAMVAALAFIYKESNEGKRQTICKFIENHMFYSEMSIDYLLSFETSSKKEEGCTIELGHKNGEEALESIIAEFSAVLA